MTERTRTKQLMTAPLAKGAARWVNFDALKILNDGSKNEIYSIAATVDAPMVVTTVTSVWPPKGTTKTEGPSSRRATKTTTRAHPLPTLLRNRTPIQIFPQFYEKN